MLRSGMTSVKPKTSTRTMRKIGRSDFKDLLPARRFVGHGALHSPVPRSWTGPSRPVGGPRFAALRRASWRRLRRRRPLGSVLAYHAAHGEEDREEDQAQEACVQGRDRGREEEGQRGRRAREEARAREEGGAKGREEGGRAPEGAAAEEGHAGGSEASAGQRGQEGRAAHRAEGG